MRALDIFFYILSFELVILFLKTFSLGTFKSFKLVFENDNKNLSVVYFLTFDLHYQSLSMNMRT